MIIATNTSHDWAAIDADTSRELELARLMDGQFQASKPPKEVKKKYNPNNNFAKPKWECLSKEIREQYKRCLWCDKKPVGQFEVHHILCSRFNPDLRFDRRILIPVCQPCHVMLEPYSKFNGTQVLPQLYE